MRHVVSLSGGIGSYMALKRVLKKYNKEDVECVFCDTLIEDKDLYRFLKDIENKFDLKIIKLCLGKKPFDLAKEDNFLYNSRVANCSKKLKSIPFREYLKTIDEEVTLHFGIDFTEKHRCDAIAKNYKKYKVEFPLCEAPFLYKFEMFEELKRDGIVIPKLYKSGFSHNNCGGFCFKAGLGHFKNLYEKDKEFYLECEKNEDLLIKQIGRDVAILKRSGKPFTLKHLRETIENEPEQLSLFECNDVGGCGCFVDEI